MLVSSINNDDLPLIGYEQIITASGLAADTEADGYVVTRLANPTTHLYWLAEDNTTQYITVTLDGLSPFDYVALAGHNLGTAGVTVSIEKFLSGIWVNIGAATLPTDDKVIMWQVATTLVSQFRIKLQGGSTPAKIAAVRAGMLLVMETGIYSKHVPLTYGKRTMVSNGFSENGNFLGRIVYGEMLESTASFRLITPVWFRNNMPDFIDSAQEEPFFFVWRPDTYPQEIGYAVLTDDVSPAPEDPGSNNLIAFDLRMEGVAP